MTSFFFLDVLAKPFGLSSSGRKRRPGKPRRRFPLGGERLELRTVPAALPIFTITPLSPVYAWEGSLSESYPVATFTTSAGITDPSNFSASIDWGDNSSSSADRVTLGNGIYSGIYSIYGSHKYLEEGSYTIGVTLKLNGNPVTAALRASFDDGSFPTGPQMPSFLSRFYVGPITWSGTTGTAGPPQIIKADPTAPSLPNVLVQSDTTRDESQPSDDTLTFPFLTPLTAFSLSRIATDAPSRSIPEWHARFYDAGGNLLGEFGEPRTVGLIPATTFTFTTPGAPIAKMTLESIYSQPTYHRNIPVDDFVLFPTSLVPAQSIGQVADANLTGSDQAKAGGWPNTPNSTVLSGATFTDANPG